MDNKDGEVDGVKYNRIGVVLVNAVKEQQSQIETQQKRIDDKAVQMEDQEIADLKKILCSLRPDAVTCRPE